MKTGKAVSATGDIEFRDPGLNLLQCISKKQNNCEEQFMKCFVHVLPGNYPLHLAAWSGNADVAKVLINTGPSRANVNEQASYTVIL